MEPDIRLLGDRYELQHLIASGGMGRVWRARDRLLNRPVAVKVLRSEFTGNPAFVARFRAEAQHAAVLHHPNIATVFDYGEAQVRGERLAYLVMELVEGESLSELLHRERRLDVPRTLTILRSTAAALAVAHTAGLVHRDVKPGNVLVAHDGTVKITDFGIAWSASSVPLTQTGQVIGTAHYLSPEQAQGAKATPASDVYALGAVAYECLAGRRAFEGESSVQIAVMHIRDEPDPLPAHVPPAVRQLIERAMVKDPAHRLPDGAALRDAVDDVLAGRPPVSRGHTGTAVMPLPVFGAEPQRPSRKPRVPLSAVGRRLAVGAAIGVVAVLALVAVAVGLLGGNPAVPAAGTTSGRTTTQPAEPAAQTTAETPPTIDLLASDYVGRPVADVQAELAALGLVPQLQPVQTADVPEGQVIGVDPVAGLVAGSAVTVSHAVAPPAPPQQADAGGSDGKSEKGNKGNGKGNKDD
jgi:eukaryotic-like serine/threonine-protein kinase